MNIEDIARTTHSVNKVYCESIGDFSQVDWDKAPDHIKKSVMDGVQFIALNPEAGPDASHNNWLKFKEQEGGWKYGPVKDLAKKEHPCFMPYNSLPEAQKLKDRFFTTVAKSLIPLLQEYPVGGLPPDKNGIIHSFGEDGKRYADVSGMVKKPIA